MSRTFRLAALLRIRELQEQVARGQALPAGRRAEQAQVAAALAADALSARSARQLAGPAATFAGNRRLLHAGALAVRSSQAHAAAAAEQAAALTRQWQTARERVAGLEVLQEQHRGAVEHERLQIEQQVADEIAGARATRSAGAGRTA